MKEWEKGEGKEKRRTEGCLFPKTEVLEWGEEEGEEGREREGQRGRRRGREGKREGERTRCQYQCTKWWGDVSGLPKDEKVKMPGNVPAKNRGHTLISN